MFTLRLLAPALLALAHATAASAATHTVGVSGCDFTTLASAVTAAQDGDRLELRAQTFTGVNIDIDKSLELQGGFAVCGDQFPGINGLSILEGDPNGADSVLEITGTGHLVELKRIEVTGGTDDADNGGGIQVGSGNELALGGVTITGNSSDVGAGIYLEPGAELRNIGPLVVSLNDAQGEGGGIYAAPGALIDFTTGGFNPIDIIDNDALSGAGIYLDAGAELRTDPMRALTISGGLAFSGGGIWAAADAIIDAPEMFILDNQAINGGGLYIEGAGTAATSTTIHLGAEVEVRNNRALDGGGIYLAAGGGYDVLIDALILVNEATRNGAGLYANGSGGGTLKIDGLFSANVADLHGGGLYLKDGSFTSGFSGSNGNVALGSGGGIYLDGATLNQVNGSFVIRNNTAGLNGGGIALVNGSELVFERTGSMSQNFNNALIQNNEARTGHGGGAYVVDSALFLEWSIIGTVGMGNRAPAGRGGGLYVDTALNWSLANFKVNGNLAGDLGGGIYVTGDGNYGLSSVTPASLGRTRGRITACDASALDTGEYCSEIRGNEANTSGGLHAVHGPSTAAFIQGVAVLENHAATAVNGMQFGDGWTVLENVLMARNGPDNGQITLSLVGGAADLRHVTVADNANGVSSPVPMNDITINNSLFWDNGPNAFTPPSQSTPTGSCNLSSDPDIPGAMDLDPGLITNQRGAYRLGPGSEAIDACNSSTLVTDLDGVARPIGANFDMGAFEAEIVVDSLFSDAFEG